MAEADLSILKIQKACVCISGGIDLQRCRFRRAEIERQSAGLSHLDRSIPLTINTIPKEKTTLMGGLFFWWS